MAKAHCNLVVCLLALLVQACSSSPLGPTVLTQKPAVRELDYDINIPNLSVVAALREQYPNGVWTNPVAAQQRWNYTAAYHGSPNVYYGETAPCREYQRVGIVVAPLHVAAMDTFTAADWPSVLEAGFSYAWVGRFTYTAVAAPGSYVIDHTASCS